VWYEQTAMSSPSERNQLISTADVLHVARLARLELSSEEIGRMSTELSAIVGYVQKLAELDTSGVPPTAQVHVDRLPLRADEPAVCLPHEEALSESPRTAHGGFAVPGFVEE
jgi:aspartyl-tRNA(Asn)/glutamyl-tRNA(Gln) amidotransferase subunit C